MAFYFAATAFRAALILAAVGFIIPATAATNRPNFLFIYTDDQRWDAMGVVQREQGERARFPWFKTPNMDRLAREGVRFRNAFVVNALCSPSRAAFLTGRYNHFNGIANNHTPFPTNNVTHATLLREAGYRTAYVGKWHMNGQRERPGFDFAASYVAHGRYADCPFLVNGNVTKTEGWVDDVSTDFGIRFLRENQTNNFLLIVGYKSPHGPFSPPARLTNAFAGDMPRPAVNATNAAAYKGRFNPGPRANGGATNMVSDGSTSGPRTEMMRNYLRTIAAVDENVGRLLTALDDLGLATNTMVVYSSDNGFYLGEHGLSDKRSAYDESMRIPLLLRYPPLGSKGKTVDPMVLNIDLASTFLDFAGVKIPQGMQGRSWRPLLENTTGGASYTSPSPWRTAFFYEYFYERNFAIPTTLAMRTETAKLIKYPGHDDWTELFDLKVDPYEQRNLFNEPDSKTLRERMLTEFDRQAKEVGFVIPDYADQTP